MYRVLTIWGAAVVHPGEGGVTIPNLSESEVKDVQTHFGRPCVHTAWPTAVLLGAK